MGTCSYGKGEEEMRDLTGYTKVKYRGSMADTYELKRVKSQRWKLEIQIVQSMLEFKKGTLLDVPVGTGRFLKYCHGKGFKVTGIDSSPDMLNIARKKNVPCKLQLGDATILEFIKNKSFDHTICMRFLDLIDEKAMQKVVAELCRVTKKTIIASIRLGEKYVLKLRTATHDSNKFRSYVKRCGWTIVEEQPIFKRGWVIVRLAPGGKNAGNTHTNGD